MRPQGSVSGEPCRGLRASAETLHLPRDCLPGPSQLTCPSVASGGGGGARKTQVSALTPSCCREPSRLPGHVQLSVWRPSPRSCGGAVLTQALPSLPPRPAVCRGLRHCWPRVGPAPGAPSVPCHWSIVSVYASSWFMKSLAFYHQTEPWKYPV